MSFRVTPTFLKNQVSYFNRIRTSNLATLQYQASSGLKLSRASDDPLAARQLFDLKKNLHALNDEFDNIQSIRTTLNISVSNLTDAHTLIRDAARIAGTAIGDEPSDRNLKAAQIDPLIDRILAIANITERERYLYGGQQSQAGPPYVENPSGKYPPYLYRGSQQSLDVLLSGNVKFSLLEVGPSIFGKTNRQTTNFIGSTGAQPGSGTDNAVGRGTLQVDHVQTTYAAGSGITTGTDSATGDTIIGQLGTHQLTVIDDSGTGAFGRVQLNGGEFFDFTSSDTNLRVVGPLKEVIYLDTQNITAGFNGTVDITATGSLSIDDGATTLPIDFSGNQIVTDSITGKITNVDTSGLKYAGIEHLEYTGSSDVLATLTQLRDELRNVRELPLSHSNDTLLRLQSELNAHADNIIGVVGKQSVELESLAALENRNRNFFLELSAITSEVESADMADVIVQLQTEQNLLEYTFAVSSGILNLNVLDLLR